MPSRPVPTRVPAPGSRADPAPTRCHQAVRDAPVPEGAADTYVVRPTPAGPACVARGPRGLVAVGLGPPADFVAGYARRFGAPPLLDPDPPAELIAAIDRALAAGRPGALPIDWRGASRFQVAVLAKTAEIPPGEVRPYAWVAAEIGRPRAVRAVGTALAQNPLALVFPCHRVVRADGRLGRYGYGGAVKRALLAAEGADPDALEDAASRGVRLVAARSSGTVCYPSCARARAIGPDERVELAGAPQARAAGYTACPRCRPVLAPPTAGP